MFLCFLDQFLSICPFTFGHCSLNSSSIYDLWLPVSYLQTVSFRCRRTSCIPLNHSQFWMRQFLNSLITNLSVIMLLDLNLISINYWFFNECTLSFVPFAYSKELIMIQLHFTSWDMLFLITTSVHKVVHAP